jgi:hypothetical protein
MELHEPWYKAHILPDLGTKVKRDQCDKIYHTSSRRVGGSKNRQSGRLPGDFRAE